MLPIDYKDEYGLEIKKDVTYVSSLYVADYFGKTHNHVLADIRKLLATENGLSDEFSRTNFRQSKYTNNRGKTYPCYLLTKDGFTMLVMGYTGADALRFKEMYIKRFNEMESLIAQLKVCRADYPELTKNIKLLHGDMIKPYHYSNEINMINKIVLGKSTKQFKLDNGITDKSIRPYLSEDELCAIDKLQLIDSGLMLGVTDYNQRKILLENYFNANLRKEYIHD